MLRREFLEEDLMEVFEEVGNRGDIVLFKKDGLRTEYLYTVVILSGKQEFDAIRVDDYSLYSAFKKAVNKYLK